MPTSTRVRLTRDSIRSGAIRRLIATQNPAFAMLSDAEVRASLGAMLAAPDAPAEVWVFAYGSLMWNPAFHFVEQRVGLVHGFHRRFCLWTHLGRGTRDAPGLTLGLEPGGSCHGVVFRIAPAAVASELEIVWLREMLGHAYRARWVSARTPHGTVRAIAFTMNRAYEHYAGRLADDVVAATIAGAAGSLGPCADYLFNTVAHLEALGIRDRPLARLRDRVAAARTAAPMPSRDSRHPPKVPARTRK